MKLSHRSKQYSPCDCGGDRQDRIDNIVIHSTEGGTAQGAAAYLQHRPDGSAHVVVDDKDTYELQVPGRVTCGCAGFNTHVYHIEQAGFAAFSRGQWMNHIGTIRRCAYETARIAVRYNVPLRWLSPADLKAGKEGIATHATVTLSGVGTTTHTDPGKHYPRHVYMALVKRYARRIKRRK